MAFLLSSKNVFDYLIQQGICTEEDRKLGQIEPKVCTQQTPTKLNEQQLSVLEQLVETQNDATLKELRDRLEQKTGVSVSCSTINRMLIKLNLSVKKNLSR